MTQQKADKRQLVRLYRLCKKQLNNPDTERAKVIKSLAKQHNVDISFIPKIDESEIELHMKEYFKLYDRESKLHNKERLAKLVQLSNILGIVLPNSIKSKDWSVYIKNFKSRRDAYHDYLQSEQWQIKRELVFQRKGRACFRCKSEEKLQIHHKTYDRLGNERLSDLEVLCSTCHQKEHKVLTNAA